MDIKTLESFKLSDAIKFHDELNPNLWKNNELLPEVKKQLMLIAEDFLMELGVGQLHVKDITISGSNAAYSYTPHSDLDLHILVDMNKLPHNEVYKELFTAKKNLYNDSHDIKVHGVPVELYVQDSNEPVVSLGEYSILKNKWLKMPIKRRANFDQTSTKEKYQKLLRIISKILKTKDLSKLDTVISTIKRYRKAGLDKGGEFGPENLAYKALRTEGYIDKLYKLRDKLHSADLSIEEGVLYGDPKQLIDLFVRKSDEKDLANVSLKKLVKSLPYSKLDKAIDYLTKKYKIKPTDIVWGPAKNIEEDNKLLDKPTMNPEQLARKHGVAKMHILKQLDMGIKVELEHTSGREVAREIALDHLGEDPNYYTKLQKAELEENNVNVGPDEWRPYQGLRPPKNELGVNLFPGKDIVGKRVYHCTNRLKSIQNSGGLKPKPDETGAREYGRLSTNEHPFIPVIGIWFSVDEPDWPGKYCLSFVIEPTDKVYVAYAGHSPGILNPNVVLNSIPLDRLRIEKREDISEAFDQPYKLTWEKGDYGDIDAYTQLDDGNYLSIMFNKGYNDQDEEGYSVEFFRNNSQEITGEGDAQRIFATVLNGIQQFVKKYKPNFITFSASKQVDPGQNVESRAKLYDRLVQRYANNLKYNVTKKDIGAKVIYNLTRIEKIKEDVSNDYLYHATYRPLLKNIKKTGLGGSGAQAKWEDSVPGVVYLARDPDVAISYAEASDIIPDDWLDDIIVLKIPVSSLDKSKLHIDKNVQDNTGETLEYHGVIPFNVLSLNEGASGYIPSNSEKNDPRFKTALTVDIKPDTMKKDAKKFGNKISRAGIPPTLKPSGKF